MATGSSPRPSVRERLLAAADELFYREGVQTVGIDRVIEHAGVAKASLYSTFGSKEALVRAYLDGRHARTVACLTAAVERYADPRQRLLAVFDVLAEVVAAPGFRGCPFVAASAEARPDGAVERAATQSRSWLRGLLTDLARQAGAADPGVLAEQLQLLYDGAGLAVRMDRDPDAVGVARAAAGALLDAALPAAP